MTICFDEYNFWLTKNLKMRFAPENGSLLNIKNKYHQNATLNCVNADTNAKYITLRNLLNSNFWLVNEQNDNTKTVNKSRASTRQTYTHESMPNSNAMVLVLMAIFMCGHTISKRFNHFSFIICLGLCVYVRGAFQWQIILPNILQSIIAFSLTV